MDIAAFFREATIRLGSSLELDTSLAALFDYLKDILPIRVIGFSIRQSVDGPVRIIARADIHGARQMRLDTPLSTLPRASYDRWVAYANTMDELPALSQWEDNPEGTGTELSFGPPPLAILRMVIDHVPSGAFFLLGKPGSPFRPEHLPLLEALHTPCVMALTNSLQYQQISFLQEKLARENQALHERIDALSHEELIGSRGGLQRVHDLLTHVADTPTPVLLLGESGTGKEVVARAIHHLSRRRGRPFVAINCGALPRDLLESELFGHEKGAFTSAVRARKGRFEQAEGGTLFLDEIAELPLESQASLLRALQTYEISRVGGEGSIPVNVRIIAATNKDLKAAAAAGTFREDLYYRLAVFPIALPPLRERAQDIPDLAAHFLRRQAARMERPVPRVPPADMARLMAAPWPGNVRELENFLERAMVLSDGPVLNLRDAEIPDSPISAVFPAARREGGLGTASSDEPPLSLKELEERHIREVLLRTNGRIAGPGGASAILGITRHTLYHKLDAMGIPYGRKASKA